MEDEYFKIKLENFTATLPCTEFLKKYIEFLKRREEELHKALWPEQENEIKNQ